MCVDSYGQVFTFNEGEIEPTKALRDSEEWDQVVGAFSCEGGAGGVDPELGSRGLKLVGIVIGFGVPLAILDHSSSRDLRGSMFRSSFCLPERSGARGRSGRGSSPRT